MGRLTKNRGLGNDCVVALAADNPGLAPDPDVARAVCDRHRGVGSDGILEPVTPPAATRSMAGLPIHNPDGSQAEKSSNGLPI